jgi:hypothetical protein
MADIRTLKLSLLADTSQFTSNLNKAENDTRSFGDKIGDTLKKGAVAFAALAAAAGTAAIAIGVDAVKAAIEDEKAQALLGKTLQNTTGATQEQIKAVEAVIDAQSRQTGVADDQLRPSLQRLLVSTKDIAQAQKLQTLALDIAAGSSRSLAEVTEILAKASDGNYKALKTLGVELKTSVTSTKTLTVGKKDLAKQELANESASLRLASAQERLNKVIAKNGADSLEGQKAQNAFEKAQLAAAAAGDKYTDTLDKQGKTIKVTKDVAVDFDNIVKQLTDSFGGQAEIAAQTFSGRMAILKVSIDETKESLGFALLPIMERFAKFATDTLVPALEQFIAGLTGKEGAESSGYALGTALRNLGLTIVELNKTLFGASGEGSGLKQMVDSLTSFVNLVNTVLGPFQRLAEISRDFAESQSKVRLDVPGFSNSSGGGGATIVNVNVSGAVDKIATARTVVSAVNKAAKSVTVNKLSQSALGVGIR